MRKPNCLVFPDEQDWIVFAPLSRLLMRTNATVAERFQTFVDEGEFPGEPSSPVIPPEDETFAPTHVTIACTNQCAQKCVYCYGTPAHRNQSRLDPDFCRAAMRFVGKRAAGHQQTTHVIFHGVGEPTLVWPLFSECVGIVRQVEREFGLRFRLSLCTGGQVSEAKAQWIAREFDEVQVSLDGPSEIQNLQRPRRDGRDALAEPLALCQTVLGLGKRLRIRTTVTSLSVNRLVEIVEFVAREVGPARLDFGYMFTLPWINGCGVQSPPWENFVTQFGRALDRGIELGVRVRHPDVSLQTFGHQRPNLVAGHFCLAPPSIVTAFYDVPVEGDANPRLGAYGWYDPDSRSIHLDHEKRKQLEGRELFAKCFDCPCSVSCLGPGGVKGRMSGPMEGDQPACQTRIGVLKEILRRAVPRPKTTMN
jgi:sulfatase maturation enzyme AslB (radical SAM superfamily)